MKAQSNIIHIIINFIKKHFPVIFFLLCLTLTHTHTHIHIHTWVGSISLNCLLISFGLDYLLSEVEMHMITFPVMNHYTKNLGEERRIDCYDTSSHIIYGHSQHEYTSHNGSMAGMSHNVL